MIAVKRMATAFCYLLLAIQVDGHRVKGGLKGSKDARLGRRELQWAPPLLAKDGTPVQKTTPLPTPSPKTSKVPATLAAPKGRNADTEVYTWNSDDPPKSVYASVSKSKRDEMMEKMKGNDKAASEDDYDESPEPKSNKDSPEYNRPPDVASDDTGSVYKVKGSYKSTSSSAGKGSDTKTNKGGNKGSYQKSKKTKTDTKDGTKKLGSGGSKGSYGSSDVTGGSYGTDSIDGGGGSKQSSGKQKGSRKSGGSSDGSTKVSQEGSAKGVGNYDEEVTPPSPSNGFQGQDGRPLTGVSVSPFVLLYDIDGALGMPLSSDYEAVHDNTFLWLYTVMLREFGDQMKNLLTDDTSNMYELNQPIAIEYVSVVLFDQSDPKIPTKEDLDVLVREAFTGENLVTYLNGIQSLPRSNPFSSTEIITLQAAVPGEGRSSMALFASRVASKGMVPPLIAAATIFAVLGVGAAVYRARHAAGNDGMDEKAFDGFSSNGDTATTTDDFTTSMGALSVSTSTKRDKGGWDLALEEESNNKLSAISEESSVDPDLAGWSEFFDSPDTTQPEHSNEEHSQYSIEDFVNEAERSLLGVRIRYPSEPTKKLIGNNQTAPDQNETSTSLVPLSTAIVPAAPTSIVARTTI